MANYFLDTMKTPGDDVWLIHGGVDTKKFAFDSQKRQKIRSEFGYSDSDIVVGLLGRFDRVKGHKETIEAIAELRQQGVSNIKLLLLGFDTAMTTTQIEGWIKASKIEDITQISGIRSDISACLSALDIGVVSSLWSEAIARSALEIMATEIPLVSTTVGVMPDLVSPAMLVEPGDAKALAHVIGMICHDEAMRKEVLLTQKRTMSQLTLEEFLKRSLNLYQSLLEDR
jgi:glycosyltransferase involved in cell wall biosynthesis